MSNEKQLQLAWQMYADENNDYIPPAGSGSPDTNHSWCAGNFVDNPPDQTNLALIRNSLMGHYSGSPGIYKCPGDPTDYVRSYSENWAMNGDDPAGNFPAGFMIFRKVGSIPTPTQYLVFIDESSVSIDNAHFKIAFDTSYTAPVDDYAAAYHDMSGNTSFADGHAAAHQWHANPATDTNPDGIWLMQHGSLPTNGNGWPPPNYQ
jgi:prepilin-type processing-associated H-X9-DG protein